MQLLSENKFEEIISWLPHGNSFIVYDKKKFTETILPTYFKGTKYESFTRKLNRWGFTRTAKGIETGAYSNKVSLLLHVCQSFRFELTHYYAILVF